MQYSQELKIEMHTYIKTVYKISSAFPKCELYGITSQLRRSSVSVILNYIEGFARRSGKNCKTFNNFLRISYGSLKESKYLLFLVYELNYININEYNSLNLKADKIGKMLWPIFN